MDTFPPAARTRRASWHGVWEARGEAVEIAVTPETPRTAVSEAQAALQLSMEMARSRPRAADPLAYWGSARAGMAGRAAREVLLTTAVMAGMAGWEARALSPEPRTAPTP